MKKFLVLLLIGLSACWFLQFEQPKKEDTTKVGEEEKEPQKGEQKEEEQEEEEVPMASFNLIPVVSENTKGLKTLKGSEKILAYIKEQTKDLEEKKETWNKKFGKVFAEMAKLGKNGDGITAVMPGLRSVKYESFLQRKAGVSHFSEEVKTEFNELLEKIKNDGKEGDLHTYLKVYRDEDIDKMFRGAIVVDYIRDDDAHDIMFITSKRQFEIPPVKRLKESAKEKDPKEITEADYEYYTPEEYSEDQLNAILGWYEIANLVALKSYLP